MVTRLYGSQADLKALIRYHLISSCWPLEGYGKTQDCTVLKHCGVRPNNIADKLARQGVTKILDAFVVGDRSIGRRTLIGDMGRIVRLL